MLTCVRARDVGSGNGEPARLEPALCSNVSSVALAAADRARAEAEAAGMRAAARSRLREIEIEGADGQRFVSLLVIVPIKLRKFLVRMSRLLHDGGENRLRAQGHDQIAVDRL